MSNQVATVEEDQPVAAAPADPHNATISMLERAVRDPAVDVEKMERIWLLCEKENNRLAERAFNASLSAMQCALPAIERKGEIKGKGDKVVSTYALWEDVNEAIKPVLAEHGFALSFRVKTSRDQIDVRGVLTHKDGHKEETEISLPADTTGFKNPVQSVASSVSYGKRYTAGALLNLTSFDEDDNGVGANVKPKPSAELKREEQWQRVLSELSADLTDCHSFPVLDKIKTEYREMVRKEGWNGPYKAALANEFHAHEELLHRRMQEEQS